MSRPTSEQGSVTIVVAVIASIALVASLGVADVGKALVARARARAAADAAALAAAQELALPRGLAPAEVAADYARRNGAVLDTCTCALGSLEAVVDVRVAVGPMFLASDSLTVRARAHAIVGVET